MVKDLAVTGARTAQRHVRRARLGGASQHRPVARHGARSTARTGACGRRAAPGCASTCGITTTTAATRAIWPTVYPLLKGAAQFFLDTLVEDPTGKWLVTSPVDLAGERPSARRVASAPGPAMDSQILRDLFANCIDAARDARARRGLRAGAARRRARSCRRTDRQGRASCRNGWRTGTCEAPEHHHRHVSHLYALFPSDQITRARHAGAGGRGAQVARACAATKSTGWAIAWRINLWARLRDGEHAHGVLKLLLGSRRAPIRTCSTRTRRSRSTATSAAPAASLEMLLQSVDGEIELLPALPRAWATGSVRGLRARGGFEVDIAWRNGALVSAELRGAPGGVAQVRYGAKLKAVRVARGRSVVLKSAEFA